MNEEKIPELDFTTRAFETFYDTVDDPYFQHRDEQMIYSALREKIHLVSFGDYLKRYICQKAGVQGDISELSLKDYQQIICDEFADRMTPASFTPTSSRLRNLARNWLEQRTVSRNVVLLLGFGLGMTVEDVNDFLTKALKEQRLNAKDPFEVICWCCYTNRLGYPRFEQLWKTYIQRDDHALPAETSLDSTSLFKQRMLEIQNEEQLWSYLLSLPIQPGTTRQSVMARKQFDRLYEEVRIWAAETLTAMEESDSGVNTVLAKEKLDRDDRRYDFEKREILEDVRTKYRQYASSEISPGDIERVAFAAIPRDQHRNMLPMKQSTLNDLFTGNRLNRKHLEDILAGNAPITRYDLITLHFFAFARKMDDYGKTISRYNAFIEQTNAMLEKVDMGALYVVNPYESFVLMCILSEDPIGTFSDVWELSYSKEGDPGE